MSIKVLNNNVLVERQKSESKTLLPKDANRFSGVVVNSCVVQEPDVDKTVVDLKGKTVYFGKEFTEVEVEDKKYLVMKPENIFLFV